MDYLLLGITSFTGRGVEAPALFRGGYFVLGCTTRLFDGRRAMEAPCLLADSREAGARTGAVEEAIQVAVCHPSSSRAPEHAQHYIEDRVGEGVVDASCGEEVIEQDLDALPARSSYESDHAARDQGVARRVEELVVSAGPVDDLRRYGYERQRSDDVGNLVVERHRLEDVPEKARPVQQGAEHDQAEDPPPRHLAGPVVKCFYTTKSTL